MDLTASNQSNYGVRHRRRVKYGNSYIVKTISMRSVRASNELQAVRPASKPGFSPLAFATILRRFRHLHFKRIREQNHLTDMVGQENGSRSKDRKKGKQNCVSVAIDRNGSAESNRCNEIDLQ
jgi:hypothetical protein